MKIYAITDTHLGHRKLEEWGRPVGFDALLLKNLAQQHGDLLIHCGDFCIGKDEQNAQLFWESTRGFKKKVLVRGNHDNKSDSWYMERGWDFVCESFKNDYFGKRVVFTHVPIPKKESTDYNVHGHMHGNAHRAEESEGFYDKSYNIDLAPEIRGYSAISLQELLTHGLLSPEKV